MTDQVSKRSSWIAVVYAALLILTHSVREKIGPHASAWVRSVKGLVTVGIGISGELPRDCEPRPPSTIWRATVER